MAYHVDDCNFAHCLAGPPTDVPDEPMPKDQMAHLNAMTDELTDKLKVLVSEYKKDDNATATMLAFNRQAEAAINRNSNFLLKYEFCKKSLRKDVTLTS